MNNGLIVHADPPVAAWSSDGAAWKCIASVGHAPPIEIDVETGEPIPPQWPPGKPRAIRTEPGTAPLPPEPPPPPRP